MPCHGLWPFGAHCIWLITAADSMQATARNRYSFPIIFALLVDLRFFLSVLTPKVEQQLRTQ
jgi:hypothetical protein